MLNKEDCESFDKLLDFVKSSKGLEDLTIYYSIEHGWCIVPIGDHGPIFADEQYVYHKKRLGKVCLDIVARLVQRKLEGLDD